MNNNNETGAPVPPPQSDDRFTPPTQPTQPVVPTPPVASAQHVQSTQAQPAYHAQHASQQPYYQQPSYQTPTTSAQPQKSGGPKTFLLAFAGAALACIIALSGFGIYSAISGGSGSSGSTVLGSTGNSSINATEEDQTLAEAVAQKSLPSVVAIDVYTNQSAGMYGFGSGSGSSNSSSLTQSSLGSGVVLSEDGYIITNNHVIEGAAALKVTIEGNQYDAEIVGTDASSDLAVIKAKDASGLTPMEIGSSDDLIIGEWVMTLGSPFGLEQSVATGIVSATSRSQIMESETGGETAIYANMIQTDAAINPGNSGGALVDADGKLIGINTLITSPSGAFAGVGFAIPVNYATNIAQQIISGETPTHAQLGVSLSTVNEQIAQRYGLSVNEGAYISQVSEGSGAAEAGVQVGDIITKFNGEAVTSASDLMLDVRSMSPGDKVTLELNRDGKTETVEVTLGSDGSTQSSSSQQQSGSLQELFGGGNNSSGNNA